jgi:hypothetical protein
MVRVLDLAAVGDLLAEDSVLVPQAVADRGELERGHRVEEAGGEPPESAIAQAGVGLRLGKLPRVEALALDHLPHGGLGPEVQDVVGQRPADQELQREVVHLLGVGPIVSLVGLQPALRQQVAERPGHRLEALALVGRLRTDDMVEDQPPFVGGIGRPAECDLPALVLVQERFSRSAGRLGGCLSRGLGDGSALRLHAMRSF